MASENEVMRERLGGRAEKIFDSRQMQKLESPERALILPAQEILLLTGLKSGQIMADVGAGTGYFSIPAADIVGANGGVMAADISSDMLEYLCSKLTEKNKDIIQLFTSDSMSCGIPDNAADYLLLCTVLHEAGDPLVMLKDMYRVIKQGGRCVIVEWIKKPMEKGPSVDHRIAMEDTARCLENAGFRSIQEHILNNWFYILTAQR